MAKLRKYKTKFPGVRYYEHPERKYKGIPDQYFSIRYTNIYGKQREEGIGWNSEGWTASKANEELSQIKKNIRTGEGHTSLKNKREQKRLDKLKNFRDKLREKRANITFNEVWKQYFPNQQQNVTKDSWRREDSLYRIWISPVIADFPMKNIKPINLQKIKHDMEKAGRSARSVCYALDVIRQVFNYANNNGLISVPSPTKKIKKPKQDNKRYRFLTFDEADNLLSALRRRSQSLYEMSLISLNCGLRAGEIFALTWSDIDLDNDQLILTDTKGSLNRFAKMTSDVKALFIAKEIGMKNDLVFPDRNGNQRKAISKVFMQTVNDIGLNDGITDRRNKVVFHSLRHTYASWLVQKGVSIYEVSKLLGHSSVSMTERYSHLSPSNFENSVKVIESMSNKNNTEKIVQMPDHS